MSLARWRLFALLLWLALGSAAAQAHTSSTGLARLDVQGDLAHYHLTLSPAEIGDAASALQRGAGGDADAARQVGALLQVHLGLTVNGRACRLKRTRLQASSAGDDRVAVLLDWQCSSAPGTLVLRDTLSQVLGEHYRSIASVAKLAEPGDGVPSPGAGRQRQEHILDREHPEARVDFGQPAPSGWLGFFELGAAHILSGADHVLFLAALLLGNRRLRSLLITVTAFTVAHSLSLAAATLGWVLASAAWIEPMIAASIVWVALESLWQRPNPWRRHALTFAFGLVHGLAFAEALTALQLRGWPLVRALLGFNLGVEAGQALVVALLAPALAWLACRAEGQRLEKALSVAVAALGALWLVQRLLA